jgi:hypothetical protein
MRPPVDGELNQCCPTVTRRGSTGKDSLAFEAIDRGGDRARRQAQMGGQIAHARRPSDSMRRICDCR